MEKWTKVSQTMNGLMGVPDENKDGWAWYSEKTAYPALDRSDHILYLYHLYKQYLTPQKVADKIVSIAHALEDV